MDEQMKEIYLKLEKIEKNMVTRDELNRLIETIEILSNKNTMTQLEESEKDIKKNRVKEITSTKDLISEM